MKYIIIFLLSVTFFGCEDKVRSLSDNINDGQTTPIAGCSTDTRSPVMDPIITITQQGSTTSSPLFSWNAADDCGINHFEIAIGSTPGATDVMPFTNIGNVTQFSINGVNLRFDQDYFTSVRAVDFDDNLSTITTSDSWTIFDPRTLNTITTWLDASTLSSGSVSTWSDLSNSQNSHDFTSLGDAPHYDVTEKGVFFNGSNSYMTTLDSDDFNLKRKEQRVVSLVFKTSDDINSTQVLFEEGGTVRGINIYIDQGELQCGFWNDRNDGDGAQPFIGSSTEIQTNSKNSVTIVFDYSHFVDANSAPGTFECFLNNVSFGVTESTSRLHPHSGDIGLGGMKNDTFLHSGAVSGDGLNFHGHIYEFVSYNSVQNSEQLTNLYEYFVRKWNL
jgi:hypothetical protein